MLSLTARKFPLNGDSNLFNFVENYFFSQPSPAIDMLQLFLSNQTDPDISLVYTLILHCTMSHHNNLFLWEFNHIKEVMMILFHGTFNCV